MPSNHPADPAMPLSHAALSTDSAQVGPLLWPSSFLLSDWESWLFLLTGSEYTARRRGLHDLFFLVLFVATHFSRFLVIGCFSSSWDGYRNDFFHDIVLYS